MRAYRTMLAGSANPPPTLQCGMFSGMDPTAVIPPNPDAPAPALDIALANDEKLAEMLPYRLGRYELLECIGEGGMARVFRAILRGPAGFQKTVAIKLLKATVQHRGAGKDFMQEAVYASRLHHPNVVDVYELSEEQDCPFIAMEWVDGQPLQKMLDPADKPPASVVLDLIIALLNGLEHAHAGDPSSNRGGMLHRDIKPSNIIISRHGVPKLVDFGIAAQLDAHAGTHWPADGTVLGTINWMSPEQLQAHPLDERSDLFSFGLVMAAMVLCRSPLRKKYMYGLLAAGKPIPDCLISIEDETLLDEHVAGLGTIVADLLSRDPAHRPRNARELRKRIQALRPNVGYHPTLPQWVQRTASEGDDPPDVLNETTWVLEGAEPIADVHTKPVPDANIPVDDSVFVGRVEEFATLVSHLTRGERLVSIIGTGGAGKTRLSRRIANHFSAHFAGGAWFVDLSDATNEEGIVRAVAKAMKIHLPVSEAHTPIAQLGAAIAKRERLLMVLDNFEQLVSHANATIGHWLQSAPNVHFLVTTREGLMIPKELRVPLEPLSKAEAIELLQQRAHLAGADWTETAQPAPVLGQIVDALDRLPLAIELAAARARMLTPMELHQRLEERFKLLRDTTGSANSRQGDLHALIDWSWQRLEPWEQSALAQLSVFRGGFSMDAAEAIVNLEPWQNAPWVLDTIGALLDKSLLHTQTIDGQPRLYMYISIREFAAAQLSRARGGEDESNPAFSVHARHADYFSRFSPIEPTGSLRVVDPSIRKRLDTNFENLLAAARGAPQPHRTLCAVGAVEVLMGRGPMTQAIDLVDEVLAAPDVPKVLGLRLRILQVRCLRMTGRLADAQAAMKEAVRCAEDESLGPSKDTLLELNEVASGMPGLPSSSLSFEIDRLLEDARLVRSEGRYVDCKDILEGALTLCSSTRTPTLKARVQHALGWVLWTMGRVDESIRHLRESRAAFRVAGHMRDEALALSALGYVFHEMGKSYTAKPMFLESIDLLVESGNPVDARQVLGKLGNLERSIGELDKSLEHFDESIALQEQVGDVMNSIGNRIDRSRTLIRMNRFEEAESAIMEIIAMCKQRKSPMYEAFALDSLGDLYLTQGRNEDAVKALRVAHDTVRGTIPLVEAWLGMSLAVALARAGHLDELDDLTQGTEQHVENVPASRAIHIRALAEVRLAQNEPAAAYRHIVRARAIAESLEGGAPEKLSKDLDELEQRIVGRSTS